MKKQNLAIFILALSVTAAASIALAQANQNAATAAAITKIENDSVKADLANDKAFSEKYLADDWTGGDSNGAWFTKADVLKMFDDTANNKTNSEKISDLKVRVYNSDTAIATYKDTYDALVMGKHRVRSVISTDAFVKTADGWKIVAGHSSQVPAAGK